MDSPKPMDFLSRTKEFFEFFLNICRQNPAKASLMYQQQTATVHIFLKVSAMDSLVFFSEYISRTAILTQASEITLYIEFLVLVLHV